ncbi:MAG: hypothetical protein AAFV07_16065, partial [Bacteroidota bacterium]
TKTDSAMPVAWTDLPTYSKNHPAHDERDFFYFCSRFVSYDVKREAKLHIGGFLSVMLPSHDEELDHEYSYGNK